MASAMFRFYYGSCWQVSLFVRDIIENDLSQLNMDTVKRQKNSKIIDSFRNLVYDLSDIKQLSKISMQIFMAL